MPFRDLWESETISKCQDVPPKDPPVLKLLPKGPFRTKTLWCWKSLAGIASGTPTLVAYVNLTRSKRLHKAVTVDFKQKHPAPKRGQGPRQCRSKVPGRFVFWFPCRKPLNLKHRFGQEFSRKFPRNLVEFSFGLKLMGWRGWFFLWKVREKGKGVGGWGGDRQRNRQVNAQALSELPFSDIPLKKCPMLWPYSVFY